MTTRGTIKTRIRNLLGTAVDDPLYGDTGGTGISPLLDPIVQECVDALVGEIHETNRHYLSKFATLAADSPTSRLYSLASQTPAIADFAHWLELRYDDEDGATLDEARLEELSAAGPDFFAVTGTDDLAVLQTSRDTEAGKALWLRYGYWPTVLATDSSVILGIPDRYIDVVALEALFAYGVGGESARPPDLTERWKNRRAAMFAHISRRGVTNRRTRLDQSQGSYL